MKLTASWVTAVVLLASATIEAATLKHMHHARPVAVVRRDAVRKHIVTVTSTVTSTKTKWVDPEPTKAPPKKEVKVESVDEESDSEDDEPEPKPSSGGSKGPVGLDAEFPDGEIDCDHFPEEYGAVPVTWVKKTTSKIGWSGLQYEGGNQSECIDKTLCSYACPPGYSKAQWPSQQPASGESHGGLLCKGGKLYRTNDKFKTLCVKGHGGVFVRNKLSKGVAICRTDYPGTENMCHPTWVGPGETVELTVPESDNYYVWQNKKTSAQYYVNPAGISKEDGCDWRSEGEKIGNWAPIIFGASFDAGQSWLSMAHNQLNGDPSNFNIKLTGANGGCGYDYKSNSFTGQAATAEGCTGALASGTAYYELY